MRMAWSSAGIAALCALTLTAAGAATSSGGPARTPAALSAHLSRTTAADPEPAYPLKVSADGRYLVDQNDTPFLLVGDSPQALIGDLSETAADAFLADRHAQGFNAVWVNLLCGSYTGCNSDGTTKDGIAPFTSGSSPSDYDLSTPNPAYFQRVDDMVNLAAKYGIAVFLDPAETGSWLTTLRANGTAKAFAYGAYLGDRYKSFPNIVWMSGNDFQTYTDGTDADLVFAVMRGIASTDTGHLQTAELSYPVSASLDSPTLAPLIDLNAAYTYFPTYADVLAAYNQANTGSRTIPTFMVEANYEFENNTFNDPGTPALLRRQEWWTMLSGATGQLYGDGYTWQFKDGWQSNLDTTGATQLGYETTLLNALPWYELVPDQDHSVLTDGYGTFSTTDAVHANDYATAARTPDGSLVMVYMPTLRTITLDMAKLDGPVNARWFDPSSGTSTPVPGSPFPNGGSMQFTPSGTNADGDGDWVLVLQAQPDLAPPTATVDVPADGAFYKQGQTINAAYRCEDAGSGIATCVGDVANGSPLDTAAEGAHAFTVHAADNTGNTATTTVHYTVDGTAPSIHIDAPLDGATYASGSTHTAGYSCDDGTGAGVASCVGPVPSGGALDTSTPGDKTFTVHAVDNTGNASDLTIRYHVVTDQTPPLVTLTTPGDGATYDLGTTVDATFGCADAVSGSGLLANGGCVGTIADGQPIDTAAVGSHTFTVVAKDAAGNSTTVVHRYEVVKHAHDVAVAAGGSLTTGSASTPADPLQIGVTTPTGGSVDETAGLVTTPAPSGYTLGGFQAVITAPAGTAGQPLTIVFTLDGSLLPAGQTKDTVELFRNGALVPECTGSTGKAIPDPCVAARAPATGDDVRLTVLTSAASTWNFGFAVPAQTPAASAGAGGTGVTPDLRVTLTANAATPPPAGSELVYFVKVSMGNAGSASIVRLDLTLPAGFTVTRTYSDRGAGCSGTAPRLTCDVAWISPGTNTNVTIWGTVTQAGELDATATVTSLFETEPAATFGDNTATLRILPPAAPSHPEPPGLRRAGQGFAPPRAAHVGNVAVVKTTFTVDEPVTLRITALGDAFKPLTLLDRSQIGEVRTGRPHAQLVYVKRVAGTVGLNLRVPYHGLRRRHTYRIVVVASAADGQTTRLVIPFRL
jgi:hypothetical protein